MAPRVRRGDVEHSELLTDSRRGHPGAGGASARSSRLSSLPDGEGEVLDSRSGSMLGALFGSPVTLCVRVSAQAAECGVHHLRTRNGDHEVDLVVERGDVRVLAVEVRLASSIDDRDVKHLHWLGAEFGAGLLDGIVVTTGPFACRRPDGIGVVPLALLGP